MPGQDPHDPLVDDVVKALERALGDLDVQGLASAVRRGLEEATRGAAAEPDPPPAPGSPKDNVVPLGVLGPEERGGEEGAGSKVGSRVRLLTGGLGHGRLKVSEGWQTVWWGAEAAPYRLSLARGQLEVVVDDQTVAQLLPGQTCDIAGRVIRVRGVGVGHYRRL